LRCAGDDSSSALIVVEGGKAMQRRFRIGGFVFCVWLAAAVFPFLGLSSLQAQDFPTKPITLIIPSSAGGSADLAVRTFTHLSPEVLGQPMVVQAKPGGAGAIGVELIAQSKPDGYTIGMGSSNWSSVVPALEGRSRGPEEMEAVCLINVQSYIYMVQANSPFKTIKDLIDYAKANPDKLTFGNSGAFSVVDLEWRSLEAKAGMKTRIVPYDGGGAVIVAILGGHIQVAILPSAVSMSHYKAGKLRPLAIQGSKRFAGLPNIPSLKEAGYDTGIEGVWMGVVAPKGTPRPIVEKLAAGFKKMTENKQVIENYAKLGNEFTYQGPEEFAKYWRQDYLTYKGMAKLFKK
jgi:tripartite-type tricarboxylate transporter receptor subunit TctC